MTDRLPSVSATITKDLKDEFLIFCTQSKLRMGNNLRSLLVWWLGLSLDDKARFLIKYGMANKVPKELEKTNFHVYLHSFDEKKEVKMHVVELNSGMRRSDITIAMILVSLIKWQMGLNKESLQSFKDKFYLPGAAHSLTDIQTSAALKSGVVDIEIEKDIKKKKVKV